MNLKNLLVLLMLSTALYGVGCKKNTALSEGPANAYTGKYKAQDSISYRFGDSMVRYRNDYTLEIKKKDNDSVHLNFPGCSQTARATAKDLVVNHQNCIQAFPSASFDGKVLRYAYQFVYGDTFFVVGYAVKQ